MSDLSATSLTDPQTWVPGVPHEAFDLLREHGGISWVEPPTGGYWALTGYDEIAAVSKDHDRFTVEQGSFYPRPAPEVLDSQRGMLLLMDPPDHTRLRRMVSKSFTPRVVSKFNTWIRDVVVQILDEIPETESFDFISVVAARIPGLVIASILGIDEEKDRELIVDCANDIFAIDAPDGPERHVRAQERLAQYVVELRDHKRLYPGDDMVTSLIDARDENGELLTDQEYVKYIALLVLAGYETTHTLLGQTMLAMIKHPEIADQLQAAVADGGSSGAVEELLRFVTPVNYFSRTATEDVELSGCRIRKGDEVVLWYTAGNRDPKVFPEPHRFDPTRSPNMHMAFGGGGVHHCMGNHVARLEVRLFLEEVFARGLKFELAGEAVRGANIFANQLKSLPIRRTAGGAR
ncbi:cytochrome P450 [Rhodococcus sp. JVH1]|uniref:cytochrome P450 n=1 Tax=Rhodococcus sp. JVH1 TaxID=745408 RepID=UPI000271EB35|nr:cytochrome P450 [Rhodococcus sp. JVH1]EJI93551.1 cytochrome P450 family protein [Rhodococcus sp. JVH1]